MNIRILFTAILLTIASAAHADKWTEILDTYATDTTTHQIVLVKCTEGEVFYGDKQHFVDQKRKTFRLDDIVSHCEKYGIGFFDTATAVRRLKDNASDKYLEVVEQTDVAALVAQMPMLKAIVVTGEKAAETICQRMGIAHVPKVNSHIMLPLQVELYRLPSSSRAYPLAFEKKAAAYKMMFQRYLSKPLL